MASDHHLGQQAPEAFAPPYELKLELSQEKTLITHACTNAARFLGYELPGQFANDKLSATTWQRSINGGIELRVPANELIKRLLGDTCELCGSQENISVHHIRGLKDLRMEGRKEKPRWVQQMAAMRRKTLVVCG